MRATLCRYADNSYQCTRHLTIQSYANSQQQGPLTRYYYVALSSFSVCVRSLHYVFTMPTLLKYPLINNGINATFTHCGPQTHHNISPPFAICQDIWQNNISCGRWARAMLCQLKSYQLHNLTLRLMRQKYLANASKRRVTSPLTVPSPFLFCYIHSSFHVET